MASFMITSILRLMFFVQLSYSSSSSSHHHGRVIVVSKDGDGDYASISEAIARAPRLSGKRIRIEIKAGIYEEYLRIPSDKTNIVLVGSGTQITRITGNRTTATDQSATLAIYGSGFVAEHLGFVNTAGSDAGPGVAVFNQADHSAFYRCSIEGFQDTLWAVSGRQFYRDCDIYGTVDFIMGDAAALFQNCNLFARPREFVTFTAQSRSSDSEATGFVFQSCHFTISPKDADQKSRVVRATLGRPWRAYSRVVIMESYIDSLIDPKGWEIMYGTARTDRLSYIEYKNKGPGARTGDRVKWPGVRVAADPMEVEGFAASAFLDGNAWIPQLRIPYRPGL
ncbi:probable pectinesterase/pectinesterase inhibitor 12 [Prosopis cineraria]|uniref:probable pectinesterase/pectinesterase inhibitor 12 n=1 Tax=Prosopis cineraria TaxID=364024 RepID=UPI00240EF83C|nr:probable pectinesterase/pectinesterase inhibitor 12 [Prosopis cineraria]XP_054805426.1 probable pectinesterase/pectinesterase inhibitor 12 [Prosopis cineraria]